MFFKCLGEIKFCWKIVHDFYDKFIYIIVKYEIGLQSETRYITILI